jgi:hypothetical protein
MKSMGIAVRLAVGIAGLRGLSHNAMDIISLC